MKKGSDKGNIIRSKFNGSKEDEGLRKYDVEIVENKSRAYRVGLIKQRL